MVLICAAKSKPGISFLEVTEYCSRLRTFNYVCNGISSSLKDRNFHSKKVFYLSLIDFHSIEIQETPFGYY
jgi:hypothetical protein